MNYVKPEIVRLNKATTAIQGNPPGSKAGLQTDHIVKVTAAAYEADE